MNKISSFARFLDIKPKSGLYVFNGDENRVDLERVAVERNFSFYYIDGIKTVDETSFVTELISNVDYPKWATRSSVGVVDVLSDIVRIPIRKIGLCCLTIFKSWQKHLFLIFVLHIES